MLCCRVEREIVQKEGIATIDSFVLHDLFLFTLSCPRAEDEEIPNRTGTCTRNSPGPGGDQDRASGVIQRTRCLTRPYEDQSRYQPSPSKVLCRMAQIIFIARTIFLLTHYLFTFAIYLSYKTAI
jgi:hypothetical protein